MSQEQQSRIAQVDKAIDRTGKGVKAAATLLSPSAKIKDQNKAFETLASGAVKALFREATGATQVMPMLMTVLFAPFFAMFAVSSHLTYYDFGPKAYFFRRVAGLVSPIWLWVATLILPEIKHPLLLIPAILPPLLVVSGYVYYTYIRRQYPASEPAWPGEVLLAKALPDEFTNGSRRPLLYILIAPVTEYAIVLILGAILMPVGGVFIMTFGFLFMVTQIIGGMVGGAWQAHKNFVESEQLRAEAELAMHEEADQSTAPMSEVEVGLDQQGRDLAYGATGQHEIEVFGGLAEMCHLEDVFVQWVKSAGNTDVHQFVAETETLIAKAGFGLLFARSIKAYRQHGYPNDQSYIYWLSSNFSQEEGDRMYQVDDAHAGDGIDPLVAVEAKLTALGA